MGGGGRGCVLCVLLFVWGEERVLMDIFAQLCDEDTTAAADGGFRVYIPNVVGRILGVFSWTDSDLIFVVLLLFFFVDVAGARERGSRDVI